MYFLQKLLFSDAPANTTLQSWSLSMRGIGPWLAGGLLLVLAIVGVVLYVNERARLPVVMRLLLAGLRAAVVACVLFLLMRVVVSAEFTGQRPREVVLLVENSKSMKQRDRRVSRSDKVRAAIALGIVPPGTSLENADAERTFDERLKDTDPERLELARGALGNKQVDLLPGQAKKGPLQAYLFGKQAHAVLPRSDADDRVLSLQEQLIDDMTGTEEQTALADAIHDRLNQAGADLPAALVVVADGRDNASKYRAELSADLPRGITPLQAVALECKRRGVPLHIYGVGSTEGGVLQFLDVNVPTTVFIDEKPDVKDDLVEVPFRWRVRGSRQGRILLDFKFGEQAFQREVAVQQGNDGRLLLSWKDEEGKPREVKLRPGEDVSDVLKFTPAKGKEGKRAFSARIEMVGKKEFGQFIEKTVQVKNNKVKVLYVENVPRREFKFVQPVLDRDRRVLARYFLVEGDPRLADAPPNAESGMLFLNAFPDNFPDPSEKDPDQRPFDVLILGDVPPAALGTNGLKAIARFVKEGGGMVALAGPRHFPGDYAERPQYDIMGELLPVDFVRREFKNTGETRTQPFKPVLTYEGAHSPLLMLADTVEENEKFWKEDLWKDAVGFYWHYPVVGLRSDAAIPLLVHPELKVGTPPEEKPMPLIASQFYGKGQVLFMANDETWRWRFNTGDKLTARFWGQVVVQLGLPHLLGDYARVQVKLEPPDVLLNRTNRIKARLLDKNYEPLRMPSVRAFVVNLDAKKGEVPETIVLTAKRNEPGEYQGTLRNNQTGRFELRVDRNQAPDAVPLQYHVDVPARNEAEDANLDDEALRNAALASGGAFYREEDLNQLAKKVVAQQASFSLHREALLWNPLLLLLFVALITAEWVVRKFWNLS